MFAINNLGMIRVLFVCIHNSARSQMAEAFLKQLGGNHYEAESAGLDPGSLNPLAVEVMDEVAIDISRNKTKDALEFIRQSRMFHYVITVCNETAAERCPVFPGVAKRIHWSFEDPSSFTGTWDQKLAQTRIVRDKIKSAIEKFMVEEKEGKYRFA